MLGGPEQIDFFDKLKPVEKEGEKPNEEAAPIETRRLKRKAKRHQADHSLRTGQGWADNYYGNTDDPNNDLVLRKSRTR